MKRSPKVLDLLLAVRKCIDEDNYLYSAHCNLRLEQRRIIRPEVIYVLRNGHHEKSKDVYDEYYQEWNYSIRGMTLDKKTIRIIVSINIDGMLIITAIRL